MYEIYYRIVSYVCSAIGAATGPRVGGHRYRGVLGGQQRLMRPASCGAAEAVKSREVAFRPPHGSPKERSCSSFRRCEVLMLLEHTVDVALARPRLT